MRIVRDLGGFSLGRSDLVRRAMSKKKGAVMERERKNFVYGNEEEDVRGCVHNGIDEKTANTIYEEMIDFAKYAFNKSHAAAYAVVSYQTAYLKYYYPLEYMAALLTSVIDNPTKVTEYIVNCRQRGIAILSPDINQGNWGFTVSDNGILYGLSAIKTVGRSVVETIVEERNTNGKYTDIKDFIYRLSNKEVNRRTLEHFIKAGALDALPGNRRQKLAVYEQILERKDKDNKTLIQGQMNLFDWMIPDSGPSMDIEFPKVEEFEKNQLLEYEKEALGIYISGHPLDEWQSLIEKNVTASTVDFMIDEETGVPRVWDGQKVILGGMIGTKTIKMTKNNKRMAFIQLEDLFGNVEVVIFPNSFEKYEAILQQDSKIFIKGRVNVTEETAAKLICESIVAFDDVPRKVWIQYPNLAVYQNQEQQLLQELTGFKGSNSVTIYLSEQRARKTLPAQYAVSVTTEFLTTMYKMCGEENVKVVDIPIENQKKMF